MPIPDLANLPGVSRPGKPGGGGAFEYTAIDNSFSMEFDGTSSYIDAGSTSLNTNAGTVSAWIKTSYTSDFQIITAIDSQLQYRVLTSGVIRVILYHGGSFTSLDSTLTVNDGNWHHVAFTYSNSGMNIYIDGSKISNTTNVTPLTTATGNLLIGARSLSNVLSKYFNGKIDEVAVWSSALPEERMQAIYNTTANNPGKVADLSETPEGAPVAWYRMGD